MDAAPNTNTRNTLKIRSALFFPEWKHKILYISHEVSILCNDQENIQSVSRVGPAQPTSPV